MPLPPLREHDRAVVVRCEIPALAARAIETISKRARKQGAAKPKVRWTSIGETTTRLTARIGVARFLVDELRTCAIASSRAGGPANRAVAMACGLAAATVSQAIDRAIEDAAPLSDGVPRAASVPPGPRVF